MSFLGIKNPFRTGAGNVQRTAATSAATQEGRAANLSTLANNWFDDPNRANQRTSFMDALRTQLADTTNRDYADAARQTKFATARQGLTGGRVDIDRQKRNIYDLFQRRLANESKVQDAGQNLYTQDLATRQRLIDSAYGAADVGAGATQDMLGQQAQNANYLRTLWPKILAGGGNAAARGYSGNQYADLFSAGYGGGM